MSAINIQPLSPARVMPAAQLLAESMRDNPLHRRVFGDDDSRLAPLLEAAFARLLCRQMRNGIVLGAYQDDALLAVVAMVAPGHCQMNLGEKLALLPILVRGRVLSRLPQIHRWMSVWARRDPDFDHWHLGPAAVDRERQGRGVGSALMAAVCERLDRCQGVGYLETDKDANVRLYRRGGFRVIAEQPVMDVNNWCMLRNPESQKLRRQTLEPVDAD